MGCPKGLLLYTTTNSVRFSLNPSVCTDTPYGVTIFYNNIIYKLKTKNIYPLLANQKIQKLFIVLDMRLYVCTAACHHTKGSKKIFLHIVIPLPKPFFGIHCGYVYSHMYTQIHTHTHTYILQYTHLFYVRVFVYPLQS